MAICKSWDYVNGLDHFIGIKESKGTGIIAIQKANTMEAFCFPASTVHQVMPKPTNPQKIHLVWVFRLRGESKMSNVCMEYTNYTGIPVWMLIIDTFI